MMLWIGNDILNNCCIVLESDFNYNERSCLFVSLTSLTPFLHFILKSFFDIATPLLFFSLPFPSLPLLHFARLISSTTSIIYPPLFLLSSFLFVSSSTVSVLSFFLFSCSPLAFSSIQSYQIFSFPLFLTHFVLNHLFSSLLPSSFPYLMCFPPHHTVAQQLTSRLINSSSILMILSLACRQPSSKSSS